ncbi:hypothetical protein [Sphaerisporangium dianthi]|uniref:Uncharacterized protein n=1 Tax=Sphaerisporangium dianthi TaxID=1436120 RepID=A0ABV9CCR7_9ACTN
MNTDDGEVWIDIDHLPPFDRASIWYYTIARARADFWDEVDEIRRLYCVVDLATGRPPTYRLRASAADAARWSAATRAMRLAIETANSELGQALKSLTPPPRWGHRVLWRFREKRLAAAYEISTQRVHDDLHGACLDFRAQVSDLPAHIEAEQAREAQERQGRATVLAGGLNEPAWGYFIHEGTSRILSIFLQTLEPAETPSPESARVRTGLTLEQILSAVAEELSLHRQTLISWENGTERALAEQSPSPGWSHYIAERLMAMACESDAPLWAYTVTEEDGRRYFEIQLLCDTIFGIEDRSLIREEAGVTLDRIQAALAEERAHHPPTIVLWDWETSEVLEEWQEGGSEEDAWQALTGQSIVAHPPQPCHERKASPHSYGPSGNYYGPSGNYADGLPPGGFDSGGHSGGFDSGGHSGGFGTSF